MGCFQSKKEISDLHPTIFRVVNVDDNGVDLCSGQLKITESELILYREGRDLIVWPLHCLRRFGFENELFSFEAGRRCETGEGIYAFRCRRASLLFRTLHEQIYQRNIDRESVPRMSSSLQGRQTIQASVVHRSSIDNGQSDLASNLMNSTDPLTNGIIPAPVQTPRSPSSNDILEIMPLYPISQGSSHHVTNLYQVKDFKREHNNNQSETTSEAPHNYSNDLNRDLAILRNTLKQEREREIEYETRFFVNKRFKESPLENPINSPVSPTVSNISDHYAQLSLDGTDPRFYVNINRNKNTFKGKSSESTTVPTTPLTPKQIEYCNVTVDPKLEPNSYANLMLSDLSDKTKSAKHVVSSSGHNHKFSESDTFTSISPVEELEVNYAVLDIDTKSEARRQVTEVVSPDLQSISSKNESVASHTSRVRHVFSQTSYDVDQTPSISTNPSQSANIGYTSIDFAATSALSSVVSQTESFLCEASRKHRHNSCTISCGSPGNSDKSRGN